MATFFNTVKRKAAEELGFVKKKPTNVTVYARKRKMRKLTDSERENLNKEPEGIGKMLDYLTLTRGQLKNIYVRNKNETDDGRSFLLFKALKDDTIRPVLIDFFNQYVEKEAKPVPDVDVWEIQKASHSDVENDGWEPLVQHGNLVVKVVNETIKIDKEESRETGRKLMRIYSVA